MNSLGPIVEKNVRRVHLPVIKYFFRIEKSGKTAGEPRLWISWQERQGITGRAACAESLITHGPCVLSVKPNPECYLQNTFHGIGGSRD